jgi:type I restriction enzyme S subunit
MSGAIKLGILHGWVSAVAADLCAKIQDGTHFSPKDQLTEGKFPYLTAKNVRSSGLDLSNLTFLREEDHRKIFARCDCREGDVLLVKDGVNTGDVAVNTLKSEVSLLSSVCMLRPRNSILSAHYLRYYLQSPQGNRLLTHQMTGTAIRRIILRRIKQLPIFLPSLSSQLRIVEAIDSYLSQIDVAVSSLQRAQTKLKAYRTSVLKAAVEGRLVQTEAELARAENRDYEPADLLLKRILSERRHRWEEAELAKLKAVGNLPKDDKWKARYKHPTLLDETTLPALPSGWCWASFDQLTFLITSGSRGWSEFYSQTGALFIRAHDIKTDALRFDKVARVTPPPLAEGIRTAVQQSDILVTITGANVTKTAVVLVLPEDAYVSQHVGLCRPVLPSLTPYLHAYITCRTAGRHYLEEAAYGAGKPGLNLDNLKQLPIAIPPEDEAVRIVQRILELQDAATEGDGIVSVAGRRLSRLRQAILKWAFEGKLVDQDPTDEPAETLLERIRAEHATASNKIQSTKREAMAAR